MRKIGSDYSNYKKDMNKVELDLKKGEELVYCLTCGEESKIVNDDGKYFVKRTLSDISQNREYTFMQPLLWKRCPICGSLEVGEKPEEKKEEVREVKEPERFYFGAFKPRRPESIQDWIPMADYDAEEIDMSKEEEENGQKPERKIVAERLE
jgi:hypothetical protein